MEEETKKLDELPKETKIFNKKWIIFVVIAIILLGAIGSYFYFRSSPVENEDISKEASSEIMGFTEEKSQEGQANQCENKQEIPGETRKLEDLKERCYSEFAWRDKNPLICEKSGDVRDKDECYSTYAYLNKDILVCEKIGSYVNRNYCYLFFADSLSFCEDKFGQGLFSSACVFKIARKLDDISMCENLGEDESACYIYFAEKRNDVSLCNKIDNTNEDDLDDCYRNYAKATKDIAFCEFIKDQYDKEYYCYTDLADLTEDLAICDKITDSELKKECYKWDKYRAVIPSYVSLYESKDTDLSIISCSNDEYVTLTQQLTYESNLLLRERIELKGNVALEEIKDLTCLEYLNLEKGGVSDVSHLSPLVNLKYLNLEADQGSIGNLLPVIRDISAFAKMSKLEYLDISKNNIADISVLRNMPNMKELNLNHNPISDLSGSLETLSNLKDLEILYFEYMTEGLDKVQPSSCDEGDPCEDVSSESVDLAFFAEEFPKLKALYAGKTSSTNMEALSGAKNLRVLSLAWGGYTYNYGELPSKMPNTIFVLSSEDLPSMED